MSLSRASGQAAHSLLEYWIDTKLTHSKRRQKKGGFYEFSSLPAESREKRFEVELAAIPAVSWYIFHILFYPNFYLKETSCGWFVSQTSFPFDIPLSVFQSLESFLTDLYSWGTTKEQLNTLFDGSLHNNVILYSDGMSMKLKLCEGWNSRCWNFNCYTPVCRRRGFVWVGWGRGRRLRTRNSVKETLFSSALKEAECMGLQTVSFIRTAHYRRLESLRAVGTSILFHSLSTDDEDMSPKYVL